jgi:hypothetical protein
MEETRAETGLADRPSPFRARFNAPFDLAALRTIYSPVTKSHEELYLSNASMEEVRLSDFYASVAPE